MPIKNKKSKNKFNSFFRKLKRIIAEAFKVDDKKNKEQPQSNLEIIKGSRKKKLIIRIVCYSLVLIAIVSVLVINAKTPTGLIEKIQNDYATYGKGEFPINVYAQNPDTMTSNGDVALILNNTYLEVYSEKGKLINAFSHGMFNPTLKCSEARFLVFDRNRYSIKIYNYSTELFEKSFDKNITCAAIGRNGTYAVATTSDTYNNAVYVFNKNNESAYTWNCANGYVTDITIADNGKSIALSVADAVGGSYVSNVYILKFDSATPYYDAEFNYLITSLNSVNKKYFIASGIDFAGIIEWEGSRREIEFSGVVRHYETVFGSFSAVVCGREDNEHSNSIIITSEDGSVYSNFDFNSPISDISLTSKSISVLSGNNVYVYDHSGNLLSELISDTKPNFVYLTDSDEVMVLDNSQLKLLSSQN